MPRRTSGAGERRSIATKSDSRTALRAKAPTVCADAQPWSGASTMVRTSRSIPVVRVTAPGMSKRRRESAAPRSCGITRGPIASSVSAIGTGSRKVQRQPSSVSRPPRTSPSEKPLAPVAV